MSLPPEFEAAFAEAAGGRRRSWSHAAVYLASESLGFARLGSADRARFREAYVRLCNRVAAGEVLVCPALICLPRSVPPVVRKAVARPVMSGGEAISQMRERLSRE